MNSDFGSHCAGEVIRLATRPLCVEDPPSRLGSGLGDAQLLRMRLCAVGFISSDVTRATAIRWLVAPS